MRFDVLTMFSDNQELTGTAVDSTKTLDLQKAGVSEIQSFLVARFSADNHGCTKVTLKGSDDNTTFRDVAAQAVTDTTAGSGVNIQLPQGCPQYLKVVYTGTSMTGKVTAGFTLAAESPRGKRIGDYAAN